MYLIKSKVKNGYILLETVILLFFISFISLYINKIIINNCKKAELYTIHQDIRALSQENEELLYEGVKYINSNDEIVNSLVEKDKKDELALPQEVFFYEYKFSKNRNKKIIIRDSGIYIQENKDLGKRYIYLDYKLEYYEKSTDVYVTLIPNYYRTDVIVGL